MSFDLTHFCQTHGLKKSKLKSKKRLETLKGVVHRIENNSASREDRETYLEHVKLGQSENNEWCSLPTNV